MALRMSSQCANTGTFSGSSTATIAAQRATAASFLAFFDAPPEAEEEEEAGCVWGVAGLV